MAACRSTSEWNAPRRSRRRVVAEKKVSTALSQEPEGRGVVEGPARVPVQPGHDLRVLVAAVIVEDDVDEFAGGDGGLDRAQEAEELLVAVAGHAAADHGAVEDVERGEQGGRAVADIVMRHGPRLAGLEWQARLGPVERLNLALFVGGAR